MHIEWLRGWRRCKPASQWSGPNERVEAALLAQIRSVAARAKHFDGLLGELPSRKSSLNVVDFGEDLTR